MRMQIRRSRQDVISMVYRLWRRRVRRMTRDAVRCGVVRWLFTAFAVVVVSRISRASHDSPRLTSTHEFRQLRGLATNEPERPARRGGAGRRASEFLRNRPACPLTNRGAGLEPVSEGAVPSERARGWSLPSLPKTSVNIRRTETYGRFLPSHT